MGNFAFDALIAGLLFVMEYFCTAVLLLLLSISFNQKININLLTFLYPSLPLYIAVTHSIFISSH